MKDTEDLRRTRCAGMSGFAGQTYHDSLPDYS
jgi:hypothetical protein